MSHLRQHSLLALLLIALPAGAQQWTDDLEAAKTRARAEGSDLLLEFTGSDWCVWCKRLRADVFDREAFLAAVAGRFVLVELDFPHDQSRLPAAVKAQNERLRELFRPNGYPAVFLADAEGRPYGLVGGYVAGGPTAYLARIDALVQVRTRRDEQFAAAAAATGAARAALLRRGLDLLQPEVAKCYVDLQQEIAALEAAAAAASPRERAERYLQDRKMGRYADAGEDQRAYLQHWSGLTEAERTAIQREIADQEFHAALTALRVQQGGDARSPSVSAPEFERAVLQLLAYRYKVGAWPAGAGGNRALIMVAAWADHHRDAWLFSRCLEELPVVRQGLGGNEEFLAFFEQRLAQLRSAEPPAEAFFTAFFARSQRRR